MMKTALSIIQSVRYRMNLTAPTTLISVTDPDELQMIYLLYAVCEELRQARCWTQIKRAYSFNTVNAQATYQLPRDFYAPLMRSQWNASEDGRLVGPLDDDSYMALLESGSNSPTNYAYRLFGYDENPASNSGQFYVNPTPSSAQTLKFEYVTRSFLLPVNWTASTSYGANAYVNASGNIYQKGSGTATSGTTVPSHTSGTGSDGTITWTYISAPYETIVADTDLVVFDDDLVKLGLRAKWMEEKGGDYAQAKAEFEAKVDQAVARYRGSYIGNMCGRESRPNYSIPNRSWSI